VIDIFRFILFRKKINPARRIALGFAALIIAGALLLMLPIASKTGEVTSFLTALFTATSATCVTGLSLVNVGEYFSVFGQAVILVLIQIGGLGFMSVLCFAFLVSNKQIGIRNRMMIAQSMGLEGLSGVVKFAKHVLYIALVVELAGTVLLSVRFIPQFGIIKGIWFSVFHTVSAFCNAGFDLIGDGQSVFSYRYDPLVLITLALLIIVGGLGFIVWEDIIKKKSFKKLSMYSKLVLISTVICILAGTVVYIVFEYNNAGTIGNDSAFHKALIAFFQSVTTRTAGFDPIGQKGLTPLSKVWGIILMMIGGASGSTAGGVKIGTFTLVILTLCSVMRSERDLVVFGRRIGHRTILHAMALMVLWFALTVTGAMLVSFVDGHSVLNSMYEVASAYSTVGLSVGISETGSVFTQILLIVYMFLGRVGIMTISVLFMIHSGKERGIKYPDGKFIVG
jgi:trk system potassium uptake protein TrkH